MDPEKNSLELVCLKQGFNLEKWEHIEVQRHTSKWSLCTAIVNSIHKTGDWVSAILTFYSQNGWSGQAKERVRIYDRTNSQQIWYPVKNPRSTDYMMEKLSD